LSFKEFKNIFKEECMSYLLPASCRVLVVEDDPIIQRVHQQLLTRLGCEVDCMSQGQRVLHQLTYDMMFLDLGLPDISGEQVIEAIRTLETKRKPLPIVVISAHGKEKEMQCLTQGANQVLAKPVKLEDLQAVLRDYGFYPKNNDTIKKIS
jgi:CheY-like chemotaxis protein